MTPAGDGRLLIVTAVAAERAAVLEAISITPAISIIAVGVGPAAAAAGTARELALAEAAGAPYDAVLCAGIAGGYPGVTEIGGLAIASESIAADLGADSPDGFIDLRDLGFGESVAPTDPRLRAALCRALPAAAVGPVLTVSTATGTTLRARTMLARYPTAVAEAMEGHGAALAAAGAGVAFGELRAISNHVGQRDLAGWRIPQALAALSVGIGAAVDGCRALCGKVEG